MRPMKSFKKKKRPMTGPGWKNCASSTVEDLKVPAGYSDKTVSSSLELVPCKFGQSCRTHMAPCRGPFCVLAGQDFNHSAIASGV